MLAFAFRCYVVGLITWMLLRPRKSEPVVIAYGDPFADDSPQQRQAWAEEIVREALRSPTVLN